MTDRPSPKPRTLRELLDACRERAHGTKPLPVPPLAAPPPPPSHHDPKENEP